jgi:hypothetical protein
MIHYIGGSVNNPPRVVTRRHGDIPGCRAESPPTSKNIYLQDKYHIGLNDPHWVYEMCERIEAKQGGSLPPRTGGPNGRESDEGTGTL